MRFQATSDPTEIINHGVLQLLAFSLIAQHEGLLVTGEKYGLCELDVLWVQLVFVAFGDERHDLGDALDEVIVDVAVVLCLERHYSFLNHERDLGEEAVDKRLHVEHASAVHPKHLLHFGEAHACFAAVEPQTRTSERITVGKLREILPVHKLLGGMHEEFPVADLK